jgi:hypothetical protein
LTIDANTFRKGINEQLAFLARHQKPAGFWAVHPQASDAKANAALYPTLLSMWAFHLALTKAKALQLPTATVAQLKAGKQRAVAWLLAAKPGDQPFWKPYPYNPNNTPSSSISGMALTILSQMKLPAKTMQPLASQWVDEILKTPPPRLSGMGSQDLHPDLHVRLKKALTSDSTRYLKLPWHLAAADASFPHLTDEQKHKLIDYIETAITHFPKAKLEPPFRLAIGLFGVRQLTCNINR